MIGMPCATSTDTQTGANPPANVHARSQICAVFTGSSSNAVNSTLAEVLGVPCWLDRLHRGIARRTH